MNLKCLTVCFLTVIVIHLGLCRQKAAAQSAVKLADVSKFELVIRAGGISDEIRKFEVAPSNGSWYCYRTRLKDYAVNGLVNDSTRKRLKKIEPELLENLLAIIAKRDTGVNVKLFKIDKTELTGYIDSTVDMPLAADQREEFSNALQTDSILEKALYKVVHPRPMDDKTYYGLTVTTRQNSSFTISALSFAALYYLPWTIDNIKSYNPDIGKIFSSICGDRLFDGQEKRWLYQDIAREVYWQYFQLKFNWENLKSAHAASYNIIGETLTPDYFRVEKANVVMRCTSSRLPRYAVLQLAFGLDDTAQLKQYKCYEDTLAAAFAKPNFLFNYLSTRLDAKVYFTPGRMGNVGNWYFKDIKKSFSGIINYDYKKSQLIEIGGSEDLKSRWILFPDNTLLLMNFDGMPLTGGNVKFMNIPSVVLSGLFKYQMNGVCVLFDSSGKVVHNYGLADTPFY